MRFIGAMMNALGSLLPLRGSPQGASASEGPGATPETTDGAQGTESESFASTLLQLLSQKAAPNGAAPGLTGKGPGGSGDASIPRESIPTAAAQVGSVVAELAPTESGAADSRPSTPGIGRAGIRPIPVPVPESTIQETDLPAPSMNGRGGERGIPKAAGAGSQESRRVEAGTIPGPTVAGLRPSTPGRAGPGHVSAPSLQQTDFPGAPAHPGNLSPAQTVTEGSGVANPQALASSPSPASMGRQQTTEAPSISDLEGVEESRPTTTSTGNPLDPEKVDGTSVAENVKPSAAVESFPIDRDPANLDPEFRQRLDRVVSRMENEFGHKIQMVEGFRSPQRQKAIYAQGRTQPGPVATWTTDSLHSRGRAADLQVDGSWNNPAGYARLQQVAKEEGLGVLGSKDPGHLELSTEGVARNQTTRSAGWDTSPSTSSFPRTARVARVASTARVARPAAVGGSIMPPANLTHQASQTSTTPATASPQGPGPSIPEPPPKVLDIPLPDIRVEVPERGPIQGMGKPAQAQSTTGRSSENLTHIPIQGGSEAAGRQAPGQEAAFPKPGKDIPGGIRADETENQETLRVDTSTQSTRPGNEPGLTTDGSRFQGTKPLAGVESAPRATAADRVQEILTASETWDTQAAGRLLVDLDNADGAGTRLRLALRGSELAGTLDLADPVLAGRMRQRIGELHQALSKQGLDSTGIEARALSGIEGKGAVDGDLAALLKDPLTGLARIMETRDSAPQNRGGDPRQTREDAQRGFERFKDAPQRDRNKENQR